jgi:hypothetical protein
MEACIALSAHILKSAAELVDHARRLTSDDPQLAALLAPLQAATFEKMLTIQREVFRDRKPFESPPDDGA